MLGISEPQDSISRVNALLFLEKYLKNQKQSDGFQYLLNLYGLSDAAKSKDSLLLKHF